ncbi:MAG: hypothetical protein JRH07_12900, partial [Deltaproteobacteria bacterium]|nr:hypothetical protein [Deltaproteobacteria bacterium]
MPLERDLLRFVNWYGLFNRNPLGGVAGYGTSFAIDRHLTSRLLAFDGPQDHSTDPMTNRWEPEADLAFAISMVMNHLSSAAQTFILMSTTEFGMIRLDGRHSAGSSIMPQKRNPDLLEVIKGKASLAHGMLAGLVSMGKGNMVGYNRDSQWTKYLIMDLIAECAPAVSMMGEVIELLRVDEAVMEAQARRGFLGATHLLESIVKHSGLPFRQAKILVEKAVRHAEAAGREEVDLADLEHAARETGAELRLRSGDVAKWQDPTRILEGERLFGGPGPSAARRSISALRKRLKGYVKWEEDRALRIRRSKEEIESLERSLGVE